MFQDDIIDCISSSLQFKAKPRIFIVYKYISEGTAVLAFRGWGSQCICLKQLFYTGYKLIIALQTNVKFVIVDKKKIKKMVVQLQTSSYS